MKMHIFMIGNPKGSPDEGMKNICRSLVAVLNRNFDVKARFVSVAEAIRDTESGNVPTIFHYVAGPSYRSLVYMAWLRKRIPRSRTVVSFTHPKWNALADLLFYLFPPDYAIVQSNYWKERLGGGSRSAVKMMSMSGVDLKVFHPVGASQKRRLKRALGFPLDRITALHVGHMNADRNVRVLEYFRTCPDIQPVMLASTSTRPDRQLFNSLKSAGVIVRRKFVPEVETYYQASDCYIFPTIDASASIQIPLSALEAMAVNLPVITTRFGGLPDFFSSGSGLCYFEIRELPYLASQIRCLVSDQCTQTRAKVRGFSWEIIGSELVSVYRNLSER